VQGSALSIGWTAKEEERGPVRLLPSRAFGKKDSIARKFTPKKELLASSASSMSKEEEASGNWRRQAIRKKQCVTGKEREQHPLRVGKRSRNFCAPRNPLPEKRSILPQYDGEKKGRPPSVIWDQSRKGGVTRVYPGWVIEGAFASALSTRKKGGCGLHESGRWGKKKETGHSPSRRQTAPRTFKKRGGTTSPPP